MKKISYLKDFANYFSENEIFENWSMAVWIWSWFCQLHRPITRMCITEMKHFIPLNYSTHQDLWSEIQSGKSDIILRRYCNFKKLSILSPLTWINLLKMHFRKNNFQKSIFSKNFKKMQKNLKEISKKSSKHFSLIIPVPQLSLNPIRVCTQIRT